MQPAVSQGFTLVDCTHPTAIEPTFWNRLRVGAPLVAKDPSLNAARGYAGKAAAAVSTRPAPSRSWSPISQGPAPTVDLPMVTTGRLG